MSRLALLLCVAAACTTDPIDDERAAALGVSDLPPPGSLGSPLEGFAIYDASIDASDHCGDGSKRPGPAAFSSYAAAFGMEANTYAACGGFHAFGQALDVFIFGHAAKQAFADWLTANGNEMARRLGLTQIIWNHQMWRSYSGGAGPQGAWGPYGGSNPHTDHVHISFGEAGAQGATSFFTQVIGGGGGGASFAFQSNAHVLWTQAGPTGLGMMAGTSPATAGGHVAFQANTGTLWVDGVDRGLGMRAATSPSIASTGEVAFQANTGELWVGDAPTGFGMAASSSPDIAALVGGGTIVAFQANTTELWIGGAPTGLGVMPGTSPSITGLAGGGYQVAFHANTGELWIGGAPTGLGVAAGTSPSLAGLAGGGYRIAFQANTGELWIDGAPTGFGMMSRTSPSVAPSGDVMFQANTGELWRIDATGGHPLGLGMDPASSPSS